MIGFNIPIYLEESLKCIKEVIKNRKICGDGEITKKCSKWMEEKFNAPKVLLTTSCTDALEMAAILLDLQPGDEVIMPSYTFVSTADAFVMVGAKIVFVDINPETMNIDENKIEEAITSKTKAIVVVHYAGTSPDMDKIMEIAKKHNLKVVEDAAQGFMSKYKNKYLGTIGDIGCYSFHETKNYSMGEGGAIVVNDPNLIERAEIIREKGTNRNKFFRGEIDKYTWVDYGSSYLPSELNCAYLYPQLEIAEEINNKRIEAWKYYQDNLEELEDKGIIRLEHVPIYNKHNAHMFFMKTKNLEERTQLIKFLKDKGIQAVFHYIPLHSSPAGQRFGKFHGEDKYTTSESEKLVRLPMYYGLTQQEQKEVINAIKDFYQKKIVIIGANNFQLPLIKKAEELGYQTHVFAWKEGAVGAKYADFFYPISIVEKEEILKKCQEIKPDGVVTIASDLATKTVNYLAEKLNLVGNSMECTEISTNKYEMRKAFEKNKVSVPKFLEIIDSDVDVSKTFNTPIIVKPTDRSGSRAITKIENLQDIKTIKDAINEAISTSFEKKAIIEEYIEGNEYSAEGISYNGEHTILAITQKETTGSPHFIETGHVEPANLDKDTIAKIKKEVILGLNSLKIKNGASHTEFKITPEGNVRIIEIGARMGGDCIGSDLVQISTGYDFLKMVLDVSLGKKPDFTKISKPKKAIIKFIFSDDDVKELEKIKKEQPENIYYISPIEKINSHKIIDSSTRYGYYILAI